MYRSKEEAAEGRPLDARFVLAWTYSDKRVVLRKRSHGVDFRVRSCSHDSAARGNWLSEPRLRRVQANPAVKQRGVYSAMGAGDYRNRFGWHRKVEDKLKAINNQLTTIRGPMGFRQTSLRQCSQHSGAQGRFKWLWDFMQRSSISDVGDHRRCRVSRRLREAPRTAGKTYELQRPEAISIPV